MSYQQAVARRYAKGLKLLVDKNDLLQVESQLSGFVDIFCADKELSRVFTDPAFSPLEQKAVINKLADKMALADSLRHFLLLLLERRRIVHLPAIFQAFVTLIDESVGRLRATIKSATPISQAKLDEITHSLAGLGRKEVLINNVVAEDMLAGMRVEVAGVVFDGTLKAKLDAMRNQLLHEIRQ